VGHLKENATISRAWRPAHKEVQRLSSSYIEDVGARCDKFPQDGWIFVDLDLAIWVSSLPGVAPCIRQALIRLRFSRHSQSSLHARALLRRSNCSIHYESLPRGNCGCPWDRVPKEWPDEWGSDCAIRNGSRPRVRLIAVPRSSTSCIIFSNGASGAFPRMRPTRSQMKRGFPASAFFIHLTQDYGCSPIRSSTDSSSLKITKFRPKPLLRLLHR